MNRCSLFCFSFRCKSTRPINKNYLDANNNIKHIVGNVIHYFVFYMYIHIYLYVFVSINIYVQMQSIVNCLQEIIVPWNRNTESKGAFPIESLFH